MICKLGGGCISGVGGSRVEGGGERGGGPCGARAVFFGFDCEGNDWVYDEVRGGRVAMKH